MKEIIKFIGKAKYDDYCQYIWRVDKNEGMQMLAQIRGWGAIQNLFANKNSGGIDFEKAQAFQKSVGEFIADAINEKIASLTAPKVSEEENNAQFLVYKFIKLFEQRNDLTAKEIGFIESAKDYLKRQPITRVFKQSEPPINHEQK